MRTQGGKMGANHTLPPHTPPHYPTPPHPTPPHPTPHHTTPHHTTPHHTTHPHHTTPHHTTPHHTHHTTPRPHPTPPHPPLTHTSPPPAMTQRLNIKMLRLWLSWFAGLRTRAGMLSAIAQSTCACWLVWPTCWLTETHPNIPTRTSTFNDEDGKDLAEGENEEEVGAADQEV